MKEKILAILKEVQPDFAFEDGVDFIEEGYLDSFDIVQLVAELEGQFKIVISALDIVPENFNSIGAISGLIQKNAQQS